jgi:hypothetical protein
VTSKDIHAKRFFSLDVDSRNDPKIKAMIRLYGKSSYFDYFTLLSIMFDNGGKLPITKKYDLDYYAEELDVHQNELMAFINSLCSENIELFERDDEFVWSNRMLRNIEKIENKKEKKKEIGRDSANKRWGNGSPMGSDGSPMGSDGSPMGSDGSPMGTHRSPMGSDTKLKEIKLNKTQQQRAPARTREKTPPGGGGSSLFLESLNQNGNGRPPDKELAPEIPKQTISETMEQLEKKLIELYKLMRDCGDPLRDTRNLKVESIDRYAKRTARAISDNEKQTGLLAEISSTDKKIKRLTEEKEKKLKQAQETEKKREEVVKTQSEYKLLDDKIKGKGEEYECKLTNRAIKELVSEGRNINQMSKFLVQNKKRLIESKV